MKVGFLLKMIIFLFFLSRYHTIAIRPHVSVCRCEGVVGSASGIGKETCKCA
ncbi:hypothetical protein ACJW30_01G257100 [Castanea mollissima]